MPDSSPPCPAHPEPPPPRRLLRLPPRMPRRQLPRRPRPPTRRERYTSATEAPPVDVGVNRPLRGSWRDGAPRPRAPLPIAQGYRQSPQGLPVLRPKPLPAPCAGGANQADRCAGPGPACPQRVSQARERRRPLARQCPRPRHCTLGVWQQPLRRDPGKGDAFADRAIGIASQETIAIGRKTTTDPSGLLAGIACPGISW